jgi:LAO/AO transport system kinase
MTDMFVLMQLPNAGDDLQAIKKGVMELADLVLINKADLDPEAASRAQAFIRSAMQLLHGGHGHPSDKQPAHWTPDVLNSSALKGEGLQAFWTQVLSFKQLQLADGQWVSRRHAQSLSWMNDRIEAGLKQAFQANTEVSRMLPKLKADVLAGKVAASTAARQLLAAWHPSASQ